MSEQVLKQIQKEVANLKGKIEVLTEIVEHLEDNIHDKMYEIRPEYLKKIKRLEKGKFLTREEFEKVLRG